MGKYINGVEHLSATVMSLSFVSSLTPSIYFVLEFSVWGEKNCQGTQWCEQRDTKNVRLLFGVNGPAGNFLATWCTFDENVYEIMNASEIWRNVVFVS